MNDDEKETIQIMEFALWCADKYPELLEEFGKSR